MDFVKELDAALSRDLDRALLFEHVPELPPPDTMNQWPVGIAEPRSGEQTVLVRAVARWRCGTPAAMGMLGSAMTLGILPFIDGDEVVWKTEIYNGSNKAPHQFEFKVEWRRYGWLPLLPLVPLNVVWRAIRGGEHDYFLRVFPSRLAAELAAPKFSSKPPPG